MEDGIFRPHEAGRFWSLSCKCRGITQQSHAPKEPRHGLTQTLAGCGGAVPLQMGPVRRFVNSGPSSSYEGHLRFYRLGAFSDIASITDFTDWAKDRKNETECDARPEAILVHCDLGISRPRCAKTMRPKMRSEPLFDQNRGLNWALILCANSKSGSKGFQVWVDDERAIPKQPDLVFFKDRAELLRSMEFIENKFLAPENLECLNVREENLWSCWLGRSRNWFLKPVCLY